MVARDDEKCFWADMPAHRWLLEWAGWPRAEPQHSSAHADWRRQLVVAIVTCLVFALALAFIPLNQSPRSGVANDAHHPAFIRAVDDPSVSTPPTR
jgi:hypothetical protein